MILEPTSDEAEILIAVLVYAEGNASGEPYQAPALREALRVLRPFRSALIQGYCRERLNARQRHVTPDPNVQAPPNVLQSRF